MLCIVRNSIEDALILASILEDKAKLGNPIDLREELHILNLIIGNSDTKSD